MGGLQWRSATTSTTPARFVHGGGGGKTATATNTLGSPTQQRGGRARGSYGGVEGEMAVALLRWFASLATAKQERQMAERLLAWRSARWRRRKVNWSG